MECQVKAYSEPKIIHTLLARSEYLAPHKLLLTKLTDFLTPERKYLLLILQTDLIFSVGRSI
jgi:hypothetical protein